MGLAAPENGKRWQQPLRESARKAVRSIRFPDRRRKTRGVAANNTEMRMQTDVTAVEQGARQPFENRRRHKRLAETV